MKILNKENMNPNNSAPVVNDESKPYWEAAINGKLLVKKCNTCGEVHHYPRTICPFCFSDNTTWTEASGRGAIYSYSVMRKATVPYVMAYVTLEEGPTMMTNIVECDVDALAIGQPVSVIFQDTGEGTALPMFTPA
ncbi:MAG: OB-fold domain-containing protein [Gammaproteobacteria bacterium]|nr:OB-fold domain-containing protein [Gammaproteobacteria bacterium]